MIPLEQPLVFDCAGAQLIGIASLPKRAFPVGVLIVVGGPQYRVGSHRQFVHLARALAGAGYAAFRFDYRGMGDSDGAIRTFEQITDDIIAASQAFRRLCPEVKRIVAFGLCDAASAILMNAANLDSLAGMILANPWVRQSESLNAVLVKHYYRERLLSGEFWRKFCTGKLPVRAALAEFFGRVRQTLRASTPAEISASEGFIDQMRRGWHLPTQKLLLLSGRDITAREFEELRSSDLRWDLSRQDALTEALFAEADHTFSGGHLTERVSDACLRFLADVTADNM